MRGIDQAYWLADKIPAYGDYAKEAANVLRRQAYELERLHKENEKLRRGVKASEEFVSAESLVDKRKFYIELEQVLRATGYGGGWRELHTGILGLLTDCAAIIKTIEGEDSDEAEKLNDLLSAIDRAIDPSRHKGALL